MEINKSWWGCGEIGTLVHSGRNVKWGSCGKPFGGSSKSQKIQLPNDPGVYSTPRCIPERIGIFNYFENSHPNKYSFMNFHRALFTKPKDENNLNKHEMRN